MRILAASHSPEAIRGILECLGLPSRTPPIFPALSEQPLMRLAAHPVTHEKGESKTRQWGATAVRPWLGVEREPSPQGRHSTFSKQDFL
jgi:hypothetical protein